jgi:hypothetical protein
MRTLTVGLIVGAALAAIPAAQTRQAERPSNSLERPFASGGRVRMDLSAGEYRIAGTNDNRVAIEWSVRNPERLWRAKARAEVHGSDAIVETDGPDNGGLRATIHVPARSDLDIRLSAGEIRVEGIEGNKALDLYAGEVDMDVGRAADYRSVSASVWAGEISAPPFNASKGGLFRSLEWTGSGPYRLRVKLWAGEVRLYSSRRAER